LTVLLQFVRTDLVLSCILVPASTTLAVVWAGDPFASHVQASGVGWLSVGYVVHGLLSSSSSGLYVCWPPWRRGNLQGDREALASLNVSLSENYLIVRTVFPKDTKF